MNKIDIIIRQVLREKTGRASVLALLGLGPNIIRTVDNRVK